jgi:hypothetical protein
MSEQPHPDTHDEIASRAQQLWEAEGKPDGKADEHWHRAEAEIRIRQLEEAAAVTARHIWTMLVGDFITWLLDSPNIRFVPPSLTTNMKPKWKIPV